MATNVQTDISAAHFSQANPVLKSSQKDAAGSIPIANYAALQTINTMEVYLLANGYTQSQLNTMTKNDKIYAYRLKIGATIAP